MSAEVQQVTGKAHPFADLFPLLEPRALRDLADDIAANGQRSAILLYGGLILDGRNRWAACRLAGVEPRTEEFQGTEFEALKYVCSLNLHRRHLSESQRAMIGAEMAPLPHGGGRKRDQAANLPLDPVATQKQAAELLNVSERAIRGARLVKEHGSPELVAKVKSGQVKVSAAEKQVRAERINGGARKNKKQVALSTSHDLAASPPGVNPVPDALGAPEQAIADPAAPADSTSAAARAKHQFDILWRETLKWGGGDDLVLHIEKRITEWRT